MEVLVGAKGAWLEAWVPQAESAIVSLGLQLVDVEREGKGLLRVIIDGPEGVHVNDCERVSHQLSQLLMVEEVSYERLEVSSPGVDRALKRPQDFERFAGCEVALKFKLPQGPVERGQKQFKGILLESHAVLDASLMCFGAGAYRLYVQPEGKGAEPIVLQFELADLAGAKLVPHLQF